MISERETLALDLVDNDSGLVCVSVVCMADDDCPHMATQQCHPSGLNRTAYVKPDRSRMTPWS